MCLKGLIAAAFDSSEPLLLLRLNGRVGAIPTYRVYRLYDMVGYVCQHYVCACVHNVHFPAVKIHVGGFTHVCPQWFVFITYIINVRKMV